MTRESAYSIVELFEPSFGRNIEALDDKSNGEWSVVVYPLPQDFSLTDEEIQSEAFLATGQYVHIFRGSDLEGSIIIVSDVSHYASRFEEVLKTMAEVI